MINFMITIFAPFFLLFQLILCRFFLLKCGFKNGEYDIAFAALLIFCFFCTIRFLIIL